MDLEPHQMYRVAYNADDPCLRGALCVFLEYVQRPGDIRRARISLIKDGGIRYVAPGLLLPPSTNSDIY